MIDRTFQSRCERTGRYDSDDVPYPPYLAWLRRGFTHHLIVLVLQRDAHAPVLLSDSDLPQDSDAYGYHIAIWDELFVLYPPSVPMDEGHKRLDAWVFQLPTLYGLAEEENRCRLDGAR